MQKWRYIFLLCKLHMFLNLIEPRVKTKKFSLEETVLQIWSQIKKNALLAVNEGHFN